MDQRPKCNSYKPLRKKHKSKSHELGLGRGFLDMTPKAQATEEKINWIS